MVLGHTPHNFRPSLWFFFFLKRLFNNILDFNSMQTGEPDNVNEGKKWLLPH